jgi:predicted DCC family thiol-disulfide oxidoreductase YuxK
MVDNASESGPTIYFDGSCALCTVEIDHYSSREGGDKMGFIDVSADGAELGLDLSSDQAMRRFHVRRTDGTLVSGARAFIEVWEALPGWQWAARVAKIPCVTPVLEISYRIFLPIRPIISNLVGRFVPARENTRDCQK